MPPTARPTTTVAASPSAAAPSPSRSHSSPKPVSPSPAKPCPNPPQPPATYPPLVPGPPDLGPCPVVLYNYDFGTGAIVPPVPSTGSQTCVNLPVHISDTGLGDIRDLDLSLTWYNWNSTVSTGEVPVSISDGQDAEPTVSACFPFPDTDQYKCWQGSAGGTMTGELFDGTASQEIVGTSIYLCPPGVSAP